MTLQELDELIDELADTHDLPLDDARRAALQNVRDAGNIPMRECFEAGDKLKFAACWEGLTQLRGNLSLAEKGLANYAQENERLREFVEDLAGSDCDNYCKHLSPQPCGQCWSCRARSALHPSSEPVAEHNNKPG